MNDYYRNRKFLQAILSTVLIIFTVYFASNVYSGLTYAVELNADNSGISIDQTQLFNISNMYPGQPPEEARKPLRIKNTGDADFQCNISSELMSGDSRLFDILKLNIKDNQGTEVYSGKLGSLNNLTLGTIRPGGSKTFDFTLELPEDVDNSYQALNTSFQFKIAASGDSPGGPSEGPYDGSAGSENNANQMPNTGLPSHMPFYSAGLAAVIGGLLLWKKKQG